MSKKSLKEQFIEAGQGEALLARKLKARKDKQVLDEAYGKDGEKSLKSDKDGWNGLSPKELKDDWQNLRRYAKANYPEGAQDVNLTENNRLVAIAHVLGWSYDRISKSSGIAKSTVSLWLNKRPDIALFIHKFETKLGKKSVQDLLDDPIFSFITWVGEVMREEPVSDSDRRLKKELGTWAYEQRHGKAKENLNIQGGYGDILKELKQMKSTDSLTDDEEADLFAIDGGKAEK